MSKKRCFGNLCIKVQAGSGSVSDGSTFLIGGNGIAPPRLQKIIITYPLSSRFVELSNRHYFKYQSEQSLTKQ